MSVEVENYLERKPQAVMAQHGKSFYWASRFFNKKMLHDVATLYTFCRYVDDLADECEENVATKRLGSLLENIDTKESSFSEIFGEEKLNLHRILGSVEECYFLTVELIINQYIEIIFFFFDVDWYINTLTPYRNRNGRSVILIFEENCELTINRC